VLRKIWMTISAIGLLLAVTTACLWLHLQWVGHSLLVKNVNESTNTVAFWSAAATRSTVYVARQQFAFELPGGAAILARQYESDQGWSGSYRWTTMDGKSDFISESTLGFYFRRLEPIRDTNADGPFECRSLSVEIPFWFLFLAFSVASIPQVRWYLKYRRSLLRRSATQCAHCGYDLRATPDRCPECGHAVVTAAA
jgi:hypothetical protein